MINVMTNFKILTDYFGGYQFNIFFCLARARSLALTSWFSTAYPLIVVLLTFKPNWQSSQKVMEYPFEMIPFAGSVAMSPSNWQLTSKFSPTSSCRIRRAFCYETCLIKTLQPQFLWAGLTMLEGLPHPFHFLQRYPFFFNASFPNSLER
jgi:hypothetical protein